MNFYLVSATSQSAIFEDEPVGELDMSVLGPFATKDEAIRFHIDVVERVHTNPEHAPGDDVRVRAGLVVLEVDGRITNVRTPESSSPSTPTSSPTLLHERRRRARVRAVRRRRLPRDAGRSGRWQRQRRPR